MAEPGDSLEERALWRRAYALGAVEAAGQAVPPDETTLAAYIEGRLVGSAEAAVDCWLIAHPEHLSDLTATRVALKAPAETAPEAIVARACALVVEPAGNVVALPRWRTAVAWSGIAASLIVASMVGFSLGSDAYLSLTNEPTMQSAFQDLLDPPVGFLSSFAEDSAT